MSSRGAALDVTPADVQGLVRLVTEATVGVTHITESVHQAVWQTLGAPDASAGPGRTRGLTGRIYATIRGVMHLTGRVVELGVAHAGQVHAGQRLPSPTEVSSDSIASSSDTVRAVINGVLGDHLAATRNPLATPMALRYAGRTLVDEAALNSAMQSTTSRGAFALPTATGRILLLVHGLCMDDRAWASREADAPTHAEALTACGYTPVALRYNTGLSIAENGRRLAPFLDALYDRWPVPVEEIAVVAHSMGGLVTRSAMSVAEAEQRAWRRRLTRLVFLGTPHHGAPLERVGSWVDTLLGTTRFSAPFAALGAIRSAGITDLRHGRVGNTPGSVAPLQEGVSCYAVAAMLADQPTLLATHLVGDGLVPLRSALGQHTDPVRTLSFEEDRCCVVPGRSHFALLREPAVTQRLTTWLRDPVRAAV